MVPFWHNGPRLVFWLLRLSGKVSAGKALRRLDRAGPGGPVRVTGADGTRWHRDMAHAVAP
ncbi:hypothetical protein GCM10007301_53050 [Azorhizobium oxalatiphilum]|uniref:Uncharacterized protein n=1 Tax=Azorhizobium oxalatiphilum TaxID=980631 RepID=A0A917CF52_9HYPH|nr:hypothetical protein GCM10007301_53050 [Azorhizobium oxalatiphilum]